MKNSSGGNSKIVTIGGVLVVVLGLLLVGMYSGSLKTMVGVGPSIGNYLNGGSTPAPGGSGVGCADKSDKEDAIRQIASLQSDLDALNKKIDNAEAVLAALRQEYDALSSSKNFNERFYELEKLIQDQVYVIKGYNDWLAFYTRSIRELNAILSLRTCGSSPSPMSTSLPKPTSFATPTSLPKLPSTTSPVSPF